MTRARTAIAAAALVSRRIGRALAVLWRGATRNRTLVVGAGVRLAYVAALLLLVRAGELLVGPAGGLHVDEARGCAVAGALLCVAAVTLGESRRVRWSAWILGLAHAAAWTLAWTASTA